MPEISMASAKAFMAAKWRGSSSQLLQYIFRKYWDSASIMREIANNPRTPQHILESLVDYPKSFVRVGLANNHRNPPTVDQALALDDDWMVRWALAQKPTTPQSILYLFVSDEDEDRRVSDAAHRRLFRSAMHRHIQELKRR
jgi:hypothetical protein